MNEKIMINDIKVDNYQYFPYIAGILSFANEYRNQSSKIKGNILYARCFAAFGIGFFLTKIITKILDEALYVEKPNIKSLKQL